MNKVLALLLLCGFSAQAQIYTAGQIVPTNAFTYIPATNSTQFPTYAVQIPQHVFRVSNQNFGSTNALQFFAYINIGGTNILVPLALTSFSATNLNYVPSNTNVTEQVITQATNFNLNIQWAVATTNDANTNLQVTIQQAN